MNTIERVNELFNESENFIAECQSEMTNTIIIAAELITQSLFNENKILVCGNGVSGDIGRIFSTYMMNRYEVERPSLPVLAINTNNSTMTSIANDYQFADIFGKQIRALGQEGDILLLITTNGEAHNIIHAIDAAHERNMTVILLTGCDGGQIADLAREQDIEIRVPSWVSRQINEIHLLTIHCICDLIDHYLLGQ